MRLAMSGEILNDPLGFFAIQRHVRRPRVVEGRL